MPKFVLSVRRSVFETGRVVIEAVNSDDALEQWHRRADDDAFGAEWDGGEVTGDYVTRVNELRAE